METRDKFLGLNSIKFTLRFYEDEPCYKYLSDIKWENGYHCKKCNHMGYCSGVKPHSRRCVKCGYDESPTSGTMFDITSFIRRNDLYRNMKKLNNNPGRSLFYRVLYFMIRS